MQSVKAALLNKQRKIHNIFCLESKSYELKKWIEQNKLHYNFELIDKKTLDKEFSEENHQGVVIETEPIFNSIQSLNKEKHSKIILIDQLQDLRNIGAIIRSAAAFNFQALLFSDNSQCPNLIERKNYGQISKTAAGGLEHIKLISIKNLSNAINQLKDMGYWIVGLDENGTNIIEQTKIDHLCLVIGQEGQGLRELTRKNCDYICSIKTNNSFGCLNASVAASVAMFALNQKSIDL